MLKFAADLTVDRPVEQVFAWLTNAENQGKFDTSSLKVNLLSPGVPFGPRQLVTHTTADDTRHS
jgi:hypothetical protein